MSKKVKTLIFGGIGILVLVAALMLLLFLPKPSDDAGASSQILGDELIKLVDEDVNTVSSIHVKNSVDEYTIESLGEEKWGIKALGDLPQDENYYTIASSMAGVYANSIVTEKTDDLVQFGLDKPQLEMEVKFSNGNSYKLKVGDIIESSTTAYVIFNDNEEIYQFSSTKFSSFFGKATDYLSNTILTALEVDEQGNPITPEIKSFSIERPDLDKPLTFEKFDASTKSENYLPLSMISMKSPVESDIRDDSVSKYATNYFGLSAKAIEVINPTEAQLTEYGFNEPLAVVKMVYTETGSSSFELKVGKEVLLDGVKCHYLISDKNPIIYIVDDAVLPCLTNQAKDFITSNSLIAPVLDIRGLTVTVEGKSYRLEFIPGEGDNATSDMTATLDGKAVNAQIAKKYLQVLYATATEDVNTEEPTGEPVLKVVYDYKDGKKDTLEVFIREDRKTIISINGSNAFVGRAGFVEKVKKETQNLLAGNEIITDW